MVPHIESLTIKGYKPFKETTFRLGMLEVIVGANGSGKSSLFEFLRFVRDSVEGEIPPEIVKGSIGQNIFHMPGDEKISAALDVKDFEPPIISVYTSPVSNGSFVFEIHGPRGVPKIINEIVYYEKNKQKDILYDRGHYVTVDLIPDGIKPNRFNFKTKIPVLSEYILKWRFYSSLNINKAQIHQSVFIEQSPILYEDAGNLSSVLHYLMTEHPRAFEELEFRLGSVIPGFKGLRVKARGGPGEVIAFWKEGGIDSELTIADLSDGIIRLLCWVTLCVHPNPPSLICIDEPELGLHPRALPVLAGLFRKASERTQIIIATHSSYFLTQFSLEHIAVMRKDNEEVRFIKPKDSKVLTGILEDFGPEEIEVMHRSDELEYFS